MQIELENLKPIEMKIFTMENRLPVIAPEMLAINEFKAIWLRDASTTKEVAIKELAYVYFTESFDSVYNQYKGDLKEQRVINDVIKPKRKADFNSKDPLLIAARDKFKELQVTPTLLFYKDLEESLSRMQLALKNLDFENDTDGKIMEKFLTIKKKAEESILSLNKNKEMVLREMTSKEKVKGGNIVSSRERHPNDR